ncbi:MAG: protein phosphatase 2C domain-containing protein [Thermaceae bacterium]|nr:protein phosphatase 2C domain-containing protein [Thermaceae bacterium]
MKGWRVVGASVEGSRHRAAGLGCGDAHGWVQAEGWLGLAVADGAGSAQLGARGARLAIQAALGVLEEDLSEPLGNGEGLLQGAMEAARRRLEAEALEHQCPLPEFATTLLLALLTPRGLTTAQIGDGAIVARQEGVWRRLGEAHKGEHANETLFLSTCDSLRHLSLHTEPASGLEALVLLTDGLEPLAFDLGRAQPHPPFFEALYRFIHRDQEPILLQAQLRGELCSQAIEARTDDDKTLLIAVPY